MLCAVVMAGGRGTRFWPLSTDEKPKQFLNLLGEETMLQMTINRLIKIMPIERIFIVTGKRYLDLVKEQLPDLPNRNIILEPMGMNTAPCIALSAFVINKYYKDATLAVLPSDHLIRYENKFINTLKAAESFVENQKQSIVTLGIKPNRPEVGYGYINFNEEEILVDDFTVRGVNKFVEKPDKDTAEKYLEDGNYLWNGGMFIWKADTILDLTERYLNNTYKVLKEVAATSEEEFQSVLDEKYNEVDSISVDYGIMENADSIYVIPSDFGWDDVGTWKAIERYRDKDEANNVFVGDVTNINAQNNLVVGKQKPIILAGVNDIFVVESEDVILIGRKELMEEVKNIRNEHQK